MNKDLLKLAGDFDKARAFELGFAKVAFEVYGLNETEYRDMCKLAAEVVTADFSKADAAGSPSGADFRAQLAAQTGAAGKEATKNDKFLAAQKAKVQGGKPAAPAPTNPNNAQADALTYNPFTNPYYKK